MKRLLPHIFASSILFLLIISVTHASDVTSGIGATLGNPYKGSADTLPKFFELLINNILLPVGGVVAVCAFIYAGFMYVLAQGNKSKIETANRAFLYTAVGTAALLGAWTISKVITGTIDQLK